MIFPKPKPFIPMAPKDLGKKIANEVFEKNKHILLK